MISNGELNIPDIPAVSGTTTQEYVYERLRNAIMLGAIEPGTSLTMRGLADCLGLSPTPVREAVRRLSSEHAIQVKDNRRMTVPLMTSDRFEELIALRIAIEVHTAKRALPFISDVVIEKLTEIDDRMDGFVSERDLDQLTLLNQDFHRTLYTVNPAQASMPIIESIWLQLGPFQRQILTTVAENYEVDRHKEILAALSTRDVIALEEAITNDISDGAWKSGRNLLDETAPA
ncbi:MULTISPECIES: GntR family transcriptional regulator [unclassified Marinobacter]|uniref:GntR family transcriptional regulator n=1 Tax=unclassified Marinobacter TaxID=83889 RepID=UPI0026E46476|nr:MULTISPECIES: GntR family transcriptional regulator [unclassified Marinobacter]MDO6441897.1 GntR family transcriptional regulator [Marinobacter sp. 2_MG-2023]MDO6824718.1 GntR family transcriptional regulator [Marinobacter sp. 1_MG-2023]